MNKYSRVSYMERCQINAFLQVKMTVSEIAKKLNFHKSTIYRELSRNKNRYGKYFPEIAEKKSKMRGRKRVKRPVIQGEVKNQVINFLEKELSPDQISGRMRLEKGFFPAHETIYRFIRNNPELKKHLKWNNKRGFSRYRKIRLKTRGGKSIHQRPQIINSRKRIGDWERDGMYGANKKQLLVCTERKSKFTILENMEGQNSQRVNELTLKMLKRQKRPFYSMTNDNGTEFRGKTMKELPVYYCDPSKPQQRGTIENTIGMLRRNITRKTDLEKLGRQGIKKIEKRFNLKPRKCLGYKTPFEVFFKKKVALAS